ncbi:MAG: dihydropteroate synthase [Chitinophagales bacterium]|nr:dihydropteroate synthase [Chitinophagales bacterium]
MSYSINCKGKLLSLETPLVMGILNVTPDSFYDGGKYAAKEAAIAQAEKMLQEGAAIIDVGGMSSKPGNKIISIEEELNRVLPVIESILEQYPEAVISIDTLNAEVAAKAVGKGASMVNDITAGKYDAEMLLTVAELQVPFIAMHMKGLPENMMQHTNYNDLVVEVFDYFAERIYACKQHGIADVIIDPGFGFFSKTMEQNYELLRNLESFKALGKPMLVGVSRKSMIKKLLEVTGEEALNGTTAVNMLALTQGANILRVHDVKEAVEAIKVFNAFSN